jgi:hypothetical protein
MTRSDWLMFFIGLSLTLVFFAAVHAGGAVYIHGLISFVGYWAGFWMGRVSPRD